MKKLWGLVIVVLLVHCESIQVSSSNSKAEPSEATNSEFSQVRCPETIFPALGTISEKFSQDTQEERLEFKGGRKFSLLGQHKIATIIFTVIQALFVSGYLQMYGCLRIWQEGYSFMYTH